MKKIMRFHTDDLKDNQYGSKIMAVDDVLKSEIFDFGNTDILLYLANTVLKKTHYENLCIRVSEAIMRKQFNCKNFTAELIDAVKEITDMDIKYALWLGDIDDLLATYGKLLPNNVVFNGYWISPLILNDLGKKGILYGYEEEPTAELTNVRRENKLGGNI